MHCAKGKLEELLGLPPPKKRTLVGRKKQRISNGFAKKKELFRYASSSKLFASAKVGFIINVHVFFIRTK